MHKVKHIQNMKKRGYRQETIDRSIKGLNSLTDIKRLRTNHVRKLLIKHWHLIEKSPLLSRLFPNTPMVAFRTHRSIRKHAAYLSKTRRLKDRTQI